jgi:RND superfamily putative drug exporter
MTEGHSVGAARRSPLRNYPSRRIAWLAALLPLLGAVAVILMLGEAPVPAGATDPLPAAAGSTRAVELQQQLPEDDATTAVAVFTTGPAASDGSAGPSLDRAVLSQLQTMVDEVRADLSLPPGPPLVPSEDGTAAFAVLTMPAGGDSRPDR